jgi:hypothetical protein
MAFKEYILEAIISDLTICQHLYGKIPEGSMDKRPREGMRSTRELLQYLSCTASVTIESFVNGGWGVPENVARVKEKRAKSATLDPNNFVATVEEEKRTITNLLSSFSDEDLLTRETVLPWGTKVKLVEALLNNSMKYIAAYRLQLFLYAKMWGAEISTSNAWVGKDPKPKAAAPAV